MDKSRGHIAYLDYLRIFAALCVIYMHTAASGIRAGVTRGWHFMNLCMSLAFCAVPLFFMISGFLLLSDEKTLRTDVLLRRRLPRLLVPLAAWTAVSAVVSWRWQGGGSLALLWGQLIGALYQPVVVPYWFMYTLLAAYLMSPILCGGVRALDKAGGRYVVFLIALVSLRSMVRDFLPDAAAHWLNVDFLNKLQALGGYLLLFVLGYYIGNLERRINNWLLAGVAAASFVIIAVGTWRRTVDHGYYDAAFQDQSAGFEVVLACCLFLLAKQNLTRPSRLLGRVVPLLMPIYFLHAPLIFVFYALGIDPMRFPAIVGCTLLNFAVCWLVTKTLATIPPLCYAFTGIAFEKASRSCNWFCTFRRKETEPV